MKLRLKNRKLEKYSEEEWNELFWKATQSQAAAYRKQFKMAADACGEDEVKLYNDMGHFITDVSNGKKPIIKNSPVVPLKAENFREIIGKC